jgi:hypothetical protein
MPDFRHAADDKKLPIRAQFRRHPAVCGKLRAELQQQRAPGCSNRQTHQQSREVGTYQ